MTLYDKMMHNNNNMMINHMSNAQTLFNYRGVFFAIIFFCTLNKVFIEGVVICAFAFSFYSYPPCWKLLF